MSESKEQIVFLKDLKPNMKRLSCIFIVLELGPVSRTKDGNEVRTVKVADRTGTINLSVWNENSSLIFPCDILQLSQGNTSIRSGCLTLNVGRFGQLVKIGEFCFPFVESPDHSAFNEEWLTKITEKQSINRQDDVQKLIDKITTAGYQKVDETAVRNFITLCYSSDTSLENIIALLIKELHREHAQIRLGVLYLIKLLSCPHSLINYLPKSSDTTITSIGTFCTKIRNHLIENVQNIFGLMLELDFSPSPLPPPKEIGRQLQIQAIELLFVWESELNQKKFNSSSDASSAALSWSPSKTATGQLKSFLNYLNTNNAASSDTTLQFGSNQTKALFKQLKDKQQNEIRLHQQKLMKIKKDFEHCLKDISENYATIEENLTMLSNLLEIIVPDSLGLVDDLNSTNDNASVPNSNTQSPAITPAELARSHGFLLGSSSGLNLTLQRSIEIELPVRSKSGSCQPLVYVQKTDENEVVCDQLRDCVSLSKQKHRVTLKKWYKILSNIDPKMLNEPETIRQRTEKLQFLKSLFKLLQRLIDLYDNRLVFVNPRASNQQSASSLSQSESTQNQPDDDSSNDGDFEEVEPLPAVTNTISHLSNTRNSTFDLSSSAKPDYTDQPSCTITVDDTVLIRKENESSHRFWKPSDPEDYVVPVDYVDSAITFEQSLQSDCLKPTSTNESSTVETQHSIVIKADQLGSTLYCWAPLVSGSLCQRRDPSGRCRIHGRVVRRDKLNGRPITHEDRVSIQNEMVSKRIMNQERIKRNQRSQARRRYPGLVKLNKNSKRNSQGRLVTTLKRRRRKAIQRNNR